MSDPTLVKLAAKTKPSIMALWVRKKSKAKPTKKIAAKKAPAKKAPAKKAPAKTAPAKTAAPPTATDEILKIIRRSKKGVDAPTLIKKTGFNQKKVRNILFRTYKQGKIKRMEKGIYIGA